MGAEVDSTGSGGATTAHNDQLWSTPRLTRWRRTRQSTALVWVIDADAVWPLNEALT